MRHQANSFRRNSQSRRTSQSCRVIVTALIERDEHLLLTQLAQGKFAGFWLLPSGTPDAGTVEQTASTLVATRTGYPVVEQRLCSVIEEPRQGVLALRFVFRTTVGERISAVDDPEIAQARWFSRTAVSELLAERDAVPNLGVMSLLRSWVEKTVLTPLELLCEDALCPCGSGHAYRGCCGWDA